MNNFKTGLLLAGLTALFLTIGYLIGGVSGMWIAFLLSLAMNAFTYWSGDRLILKMHGAKHVSAADAPEFYQMVRSLAIRANLPMPSLYIIQADQPNAFATGRNPHNAAVAATTGLLNRLNEEEVAAVMAHELAHIKNYDTLIMTITAVFAGGISMLVQFAMFFGGNRRENSIGPIGTIILVLLAPLAAMLVQMAISRTREYIADQIGAEICLNPRALASALHKISRTNIYNSSAEANPAAAHLFIINPLSGERMDNLFSTHPSTENRIRKLLEMDIKRPTHRKGPWG